jgi:nitrogen regulatory protein PII
VSLVFVAFLGKGNARIVYADSYGIDPTVKAIIKGGRTGKIGDGKIFVLDLPRCIRIRTGEEGKEAIG